MRTRRKAAPKATWEGADDQRIRVLVECGSNATPSLIASAVEREGYDVRVCHGPSEAGCDLLAHGACALLDGADVVVNLLTEDEHGPEVLEGTLGLRRPPAIVIDDPTTVVDDGPARVEVVASPLTRTRLHTAIRRAAEHRGATTRANDPDDHEVDRLLADSTVQSR